MIYDTAKIVNNGKLIIKDSAIVGDFCYLECSGEVYIGENASIGAGTKIIGGNKIYISHDVSIGYNAVLLGSTDNYDASMAHNPEKKRDITRDDILIGNNSFIGANSVVMPDVVLQQGTVIGALSYVPRGFRSEPWTIYWGRPVKKIKKREVIKDASERY